MVVFGTNFPRITSIRFPESNPFWNFRRSGNPKYYPVDSSSYPTQANSSYFNIWTRGFSDEFRPNAMAAHHFSIYGDYSHWGFTA